MENNICNGCTLCCHIYTIYIFPQEAKKIAKYLKLKFKDFIEKYTDLYIELFTYKKNMNTKNFETIELNGKKYVVFISLALKKDKKCIFLKETECKIYKVRPLLCKLFPQFKPFGAEYNFCKISNKLPTLSKKEIESYYKVLEHYLKELKNKGFKKIWKYIPKTTILVIDGKTIKNKDIVKKVRCFYGL